MSTPTAAVFGHPSYDQMDELIDAVEALTSIDNAMSSTSEHPVQNKVIKAYVDSNKSIAHYEATTTASKPYSVGDYLGYDGKLYKVTAAIAQGGTIITTGTNANVEQTTAGDQITAIQSAISNDILRFDSIAVSAGTGNIATKSDSKITADHVVVECVWGNPSYITTNVTATTAAGSLTLNGTATAATTATVTLVKKDN